MPSRVFVTHANDALTASVFTHAIASAAALRALLSPAAGRRALRQVWQAVAAPHAGPIEAPPDGPDALAARAVALLPRRAARRARG